MSNRTRDLEGIIGAALDTVSGVRERIRSRLAESGRLVLAGVALGAFGALVLARSVAGLLFGIGASDAATFLATAGGLASAAMIASYWPARRASRVDPLATLRAE